MDDTALRLVCQRFLDKSIGLVELQERLETVQIPEGFDKSLEKLLNDLEEIRFTKLENNYYVYAAPLVKNLLSSL